MTILAKIGFCRQKHIFAGKNYFCQSGFYCDKTGFFPSSGKNLPTLTKSKFKNSYRVHNDSNTKSITQ